MVFELKDTLPITLSTKKIAIEKECSSSALPFFGRIASGMAALLSFWMTVGVVKLVRFAWTI